MEGYRVVTMEGRRPMADIFVTATGNKDIIRHDHMAAMKDQAIVCNIGHFDNEIDIASPCSAANGRTSSRRSTTSSFPTASASSCWPGAPEPRLRHRPPQLRDVEQFHQPGAGADRVVRQTGDYPIGVYILPKKLDEEVAPHLTQDRPADRLTPGPGRLYRRAGDGPYKADHYRY